MQESKKFAFDVCITFFASVVTLPLGFVIIILLGRYLGAGDLGLYRMTLTIYGVAMLVAAIGIPEAMVKYVAEFKEDRNKLNQIASSGVITSLFLGIGLIAVFYFSSDVFAEIFNMPRLSGLIKILSPVFPFALMNVVLLGLLNGLREMKKHAAAIIVQSVLMVIVTVSLIYYGFGVAGAVIGVVLSSVGSCLFLILVTKNHFEITFGEYIPTTKKMLKFGVQVFGAMGMNMINYQADIILIGYFLTATDVGYYAVAVGLSRFFWIIPQSIHSITYPATSEYWAKNNHSALNKVINKSMKYTTCILLLFGLGIGFFAKEIITTIFGNEFICAVLPLQILIIGTVIFGIYKSIGGVLASIERVDLSLKITGLGALVNIILNISLIQVFGILGAAIATITSFSFVSILLLYFICKLIQVKIDTRWYAKIFALTSILIFLAFMVSSSANPYLVYLILLCLYGLLIIKFMLTKEDKEYFRTLLSSFFSSKSN